jgi:hypothetical protein
MWQHLTPYKEPADNYNTGIKLQEVRIGSDKALKVMKIMLGSSSELCCVINVRERVVKTGILTATQAMILQG